MRLEPRPFLQRLVFFPNHHHHVPVRRVTRVKKTFASKYKPIGASHVAIEYMDAHYPRLYGNENWPLIRCALLSRQKYGMLFNPYLDVAKCHAVALDAGAEDIMEEARNTLRKLKTGNWERVEKNVPPVDTDEALEFDEAEKTEQCLCNTLNMTDADESLDFYLPAQKIYRREGIDLHGDKEEAEEADMQRAMRKPHRVVVEEPVDDQIFKPCVDDISEFLQMAVSPKGCVESYPKPYHQLDRLGYFLFDAASILPIVALDIREDDVIADICAAPGGKTLGILFAKRAKHVFAIDKSWARMQRFKEVMFSYLPKELIQPLTTDNRLTFKIRDAQSWQPEMVFDKVLADVPCSNDRISVTNDENNIFAPGKIHERESLPEYQALLLYRAFNMCKPGGVVVYSTCTLSPSQNDGVIRRFFEQYKKHNPRQPQPVLSNLKSLEYLFGNHYSFFSGCQYGIQVIPTLQANFGPMYIAKFRKPDPENDDSPN